VEAHVVLLDDPPLFLAQLEGVRSLDEEGLGFLHLLVVLDQQGLFPFGLVEDVVHHHAEADRLGGFRVFFGESNGSAAVEEGEEVQLYFSPDAHG
jgi:hypothetical protein